jgi:hypothetical protein
VEESVAEVRRDCSHAAVRARVTCHRARTRKPTTAATGTAGDHSGSHPETAAAVTVTVTSNRTSSTRRRRAAAARAARRVVTAAGEVAETLDTAVEPLVDAGLRTGTAAEEVAGGGLAPALPAPSVRPSTRMAVENRSTERLRTASSWRRRVSGTK